MPTRHARGQRRRLKAPSRYGDQLPKMARQDRVEAMENAGVELGLVARGPGRNPSVEAYRVLDDALDRGVFQPGCRLPGERVLAARLGISRSTVRNVLGALGDSGRLQPAPYRGWFVADRKLVHEPNRLRGFTEMARDQDRQASSRVLRCFVRRPQIEEAERLGLSADASVVQLERLRSLDGKPISVEYSCLPEARVPGLDAADLLDRSLYEVLSTAYGIVASRCDYQLQAEGADADASRLLGIEVGAPVLVGYQRTYDQQERCFDTGRQVYRGDSYTFEASLFRF